MTDIQLYLAIGLPALMALLSIGVNVALYLHVSSTLTSTNATLTGTMNNRFDAIDRRFESIERRLELIQGDCHQMDIRLTKLEK
jgi:hypothetical protein